MVEEWAGVKWVLRSHCVLVGERQSTSLGPAIHVDFLWEAEIIAGVSLKSGRVPSSTTLLVADIL